MLKDTIPTVNPLYECLKEIQDELESSISEMTKAQESLESARSKLKAVDGWGNQYNWCAYEIGDMPSDIDEMKRVLKVIINMLGW